MSREEKWKSSYFLSTAHSPFADFSYDMSSAVTFLSPASEPSRYDEYSSSAQIGPLGYDHTHVLGNCPFCRQQSENFSASRSDLPETPEVESSTRVTLSPEAQALAAGPKTGAPSPTAQNQTEQIGQTGENASQDQSSSTEPVTKAIPSEQDKGQGGRDDGKRTRPGRRVQAA